MNGFMDGMMNDMMNGVANGTIYITYGLLALFAILVLLWFYRATRLVMIFIKMALEVLEGKPLKKKRFLPFYDKKEVTATYKGREVSIGVLYSGLKGEFLPMPHIQMRLKECIGYNYSRLPNYAVIESNALVYKVKLSIFWGAFDKSYPQIFTKNYLIIALEKLLSTAEDVERGRTVKQVFK